MEQVRVFFRYRYLLANLISRDIKVKYRRSALGLIWSVLNPLLMMIVQFTVFSKMFNNASIPNFPVYLISGSLMFQFFSESTQLAMSSMLSASSLIKKVYVPKYIFPLEKVLFSLINSLFSSIAMILVMFVTGLQFTPYMLLAPIPLILMMFFNIGVGLILSSAVVFFRDITHLYGVLIMALTYFTPLFYDENALQVTSPMVYAAMHYSPIYWYVAMFRQIILHGLPPTWTQLVVCITSGVVALVIGLLVFRKAQDKFILYV